MKGKKRLIALLLSVLMVLSQMSVATFALDAVADENSDQTVEEQAAEETQPEADVKTAASETEPAATEPAVAETATEPEAAQPAAAEPAKAEPAKAEEKKAEPENAEAKEEAFDQSQTVDGVTVNVSAAKGVFPAGSKLSVSKVAVPDAVDTSDAEAAYAFDISILANGEKIQPDGNATVSFTTAEVADYDTAVYHMDGGAQKMSVSESGETASVKTSGFSVYVIEFTDEINSKTFKYNYNIAGSFPVSLLFSDVMQNLWEEGHEHESGHNINPTDKNHNPRKVKNFVLKSGNAEVVELPTIEGAEDCTAIYIKVLKGGQATFTVDIGLYNNPDQYATHEITVKAPCKVTFDLGEAPGEAPADQIVMPGGYANKPVDPTWTGHGLEGWFLGDASTPFDFGETAITKDIELVAHWNHPWRFARESNNFEGKVYCEAPNCKYNKGFEIAIDAYDVYHRDKVEVKVDGPTPKEGYPAEQYQIGEIQYYEGEITTDAGFEGKTPVSFDKVNSTEGDYTARVIIGTDNKPSLDCLFKSFQVVSAGPIAAEGLVYKDGRCVVADDDMRPEGTSAIVLYKHPTTGKYVRREKLLNDGSIPIGETKIDYIVLPNDDYDPENPEKYQIGYGDVTIDIAGRMFTISYDLNGGKLNGQTGVVTTKVEEGTVITLPSPTRSGYKFDYWEGSKYNAGDKYTVTADHTFKAVWKANKKGVDTGDTNDIAGLLALMIASVGALGAIGYRRRKENQ